MKGRRRWRRQRRRGGGGGGANVTVAAKNHLGPEKSVTVGASCISPSCCPQFPPPKSGFRRSTARLLVAGGAGCGGVNGNACMREETLLISRNSASRLEWC